MSASAATATMMAPVFGSSVADRLIGYAAADRMLSRALRPGRLRINGFRIFPSGLDEAACMVARSLITDNVPAAAVAFPRGRGPHAAMLGLYLSLQRLARPGRLSGSVLVSTARGDVSKVFREMTFEGTEFAKLTPGRLVGGSATFRPLDRSPRRGISQADGFLLFARPNTLGWVAKNVIWAMVVDTVGTAGPRPFARPDADPDSWTRTWDSNVAAGRKQLWVGELEDPDFARFCSDHHIPTVSFDWQLVEQLVQDGGSVGVGSVTTSRLAERARRRPSVAYRIVEDPERDYLAREIYALLGRLRQRGGRDHEPDVVKTAWKLCGLLCRLPCTKQAYEAATGSARFAETVDRMWKTVNNTRSAAFVGRKWKDAFNRYWDPIRSALRKLIRLQEDEDTCSKYLALIERICEAQVRRERLRVVCQTNAERSAVKTVLSEFGVDKADVTVHSFGARFDHGPDGKTVTLLVGPPPPWRAAVLATGEQGHVEVLCYRHELARVRARVQEAERSHEAENTAALNRLLLGTQSARRDDEDTRGQLVELPGYTVRPAVEPVDEWSTEIPPADSTLWQELLAKYGQELPEPDSSDDVDETTAEVLAKPYNGLAQLVSFTDAPPVFFRSDAEVEVLLDDADNGELTDAVPVGELQEGMSIAFLPGGQRTLLEQVLAAYDERLFLEAKMFEPLWRQALSVAVAERGIAGLAALTERTTAAVRSWVMGKNIPQQPWRFKRVLEAAGDEETLRAQQPLWEYLTATRGPHRHIGRLNRQAIAEAAREDRDQARLHELERYVGRDLEDLYDQVELVTVTSVSSPTRVPLSHCGRYLPDDDPYLRSCS
jgi:hypothetical protein